MYNTLGTALRLGGLGAAAPAFSGLLDLVPNAIGAWDSGRLLRAAYTGAIVRLRRASDNAELDFSAVNNVVNETAVTAWAGGAFFIVTEYDQTGGGFHATQSTALTQPTGAFVSGRLEAVYDGAGDLLDFYSVGYAAAFSGNEGSIIARNKVSGVGIWTDGLQHNTGLERVDANNSIQLSKRSTDSQYRFNRVGGATSKNVDVTGLSTTGFFQPTLTWSAAADQMIAYWDGAQTGTTQTGIGTYVGTLNSGRAVIGAAATAGTTSWSGSITTFVSYARPISAAEAALAYGFLNT